MGDIQKNKALCVQFYTLIGDNKLDEAMALVDPNAEWWLPGNLPTSGSHKGRDAVIALFNRVCGTLTGEIEFEYGAITAEEDRVAMQISLQTGLAKGGIYKNTYHMLFWVQDGVIKRCCEYLDTQCAQQAIFDG